jgi:hypothetical protein
MTWMSFRFGRMRVSNRGVSARMGPVRVGRGWRSGGRQSGGGLLAGLIESFMPDRPRDLSVTRELSVEELQAMPDDAKRRAWEAKTAKAKQAIGKEAVAEEREAVDEMTDEEVDAALAANMWEKKRRDKAAFAVYLASLPGDGREIVERVMREHPA